MTTISRYHAVQRMSAGITPTAAAQAALAKISFYYPDFAGAIVAVDATGAYGAAYRNFAGFPYTVYSPELGKSTILNA